MIGNMPTIRSRFSPMHPKSGASAFAGRHEESPHRQILVEIGPMDSDPAPDQSPVVSLLLCCVPQARKPLDGHMKKAPVFQMDDQLVVGSGNRRCSGLMRCRNTHANAPTECRDVGPRQRCSPTGCGRPAGMVLLTRIHGDRTRTRQPARSPCRRPRQHGEHSGRDGQGPCVAVQARSTGASHPSSLGSPGAALSM